MAAALIAKEYPGTTVVTDSITSDQLTEYLEQCLGLKHLRYKRGYRNVINKAMELNEHGIDSQLAIETSGHAAYKENYFLDDGAYLATKIVIKLAQIRNAGLAAAGGSRLSAAELPSLPDKGSGHRCAALQPQRTGRIYGIQIFHRTRGFFRLCR